MLSAMATCDSTDYANSTLPSVRLYVIWHKLYEEADETNAMLHDICTTALQLPHLLTVAPTHIPQFF